jgi:alkylated DNA repair dioxygenase AlkB
MRALASQGSLFGHEEPRVDADLRGVGRVTLGGRAWVDHLPGWLEGHEALFASLRATTRWRHQRRRMYERIVDVPRLVAELREASATLSRRYGIVLDRISLAYYRDGHDSVAWHGDRMGRLVDDTVVAILSVGAPRRFLLRPVAGGPSRAFDLGWGDLLVMGGSCQRTWQHAVPKMALAGPRISVQFRPDTDETAT